MKSKVVIKYFNDENSGKFVLIPSGAGMRQHKFFEFFFLKTLKLNYKLL